jgi:hypothetical protein
MPLAYLPTLICPLPFTYQPWDHLELLLPYEPPPTYSPVPLSQSTLFISSRAILDLGDC